MSPYLKNFAVPLGLFAICALIIARLGPIWLGYADLLVAAPWVILALTMVVSFYLLQYGFLYLSMLLLVLYGVIRWQLQTELAQPDTFVFYVVINLLFPLLLMGVVLLSERPPQSIWVWVLFAVGSLMLWLPLVLSAPTVLSAVPDSLWSAVFAGSPFPIVLLVTYVPVLAFLAALYYLKPSGFIAHSLLATLAVLGLFLWFDVALISSLVLSVLSLSLAVALVQEAFMLAYMDELTGIPGRKALQKQLAGLGRRYAIAMLDVDHFKAFNDTYGHDVGDQVLRLVAARVRAVSHGGRAYRYGGEEFTIVFPGKTAQQAVPALESVRESIAGYTLQLRQEDRPDDDKVGRNQRGKPKGRGVNVTISIGVAEPADDLTEPKAVMKAADQLLYKAKKAGRNCVKAA
ncbi:sensor domain-containing diguanylate cyclase [Reinekea blandensis]|uniref:diguanylate cyclase n=1 Tax=Reinekea blandensis MED297 TaxID=314283 RepID=A4BK52_9GAMM|nr:GGDEF domain-containing protein [Reinekea blandensis]EAR07481.1 GGDEF domain protein [Reinekea sp. MED297] [Reinekea blandensis MED297]